MSPNVLFLTKDLKIATQVVKSAQQHGLMVRVSDKAEKILKTAQLSVPKCILLDWAGCEADAFKVIKTLQDNADLKGVATIGYSLSGRDSIGDLAQRAGCLRVYGKSEFLLQLSDVWTRYAL